MEINEFSDLSDAEFEAQMLGLKLPARISAKKASYLFLADHEISPIKNEEDTAALNDTLPLSVDWKKAGMVSTPENQGHCGACWAFTAAAALESLATIKGVFDSVPEFSVQQLVDCDQVNRGCSGGWMTDAYAYAGREGIELKDTYPTRYVGHKRPCEH